MSLRIRVISGGQTGADRGALDAALALGVPVGGWCPKGRRDEVGAIPATYSFLKETDQPAYLQRTEWNIRDADVTLILHRKLPLGPGSRATGKLAERMKKPSLQVNISEPEALVQAAAYLRLRRAGIVNFAGPRESGDPGIQEAVTAFTKSLLIEIGAVS